MASSVDICNLALARLGDEASVVSIDPPDPSAQANYCRLFYGMTLQSVLTDHSWSFANQVAALASVTNNDSRWLYAYALPSDCLQVNAVFATGATTHLKSDNDPQFVVKLGASGQRELFTDQAGVTLQYTVAITDTSLFHSLFVDALAWRLAANLAGVIIKGDTAAAASLKLMQAYKATLKAAAEADANSDHLKPSMTPTGIAARA